METPINMETPKRGRKTNEIEFEKQLVVAFEYIVWQRMSYTEFRDTYSKEMGISTRQAENVWAEVKKRLKERFAGEREELLETQLSRYQDLLESARTRGNTRVMRETLADISKLYGLDQTKIDITSGGEPLTVNIILDKE
jgi:hypothetical protein